jgi:hypothetical protein
LGAKGKATLTTIATFISGVAGCSPTGVKRAYTYPPTSLNTADLPASFVMPPDSGKSAQVSTCGAGEKTRMCQFVVAVEAVAQDTQTANYAALVAMADYVETAIEALDLTTYKLTYEINTTSEIVVAGVQYWGVSATVSGVD